MTAKLVLCMSFLHSLFCEIGRVHAARIISPTHVRLSHDVHIDVVPELSMAERPSESRNSGTQLRNRVFGIRHGLVGCSVVPNVLVYVCTRWLQAESNVQRVLVSEPAVGVVSYGLTEKGRQQAKEVYNSHQKGVAELQFMLPCIPFPLVCFFAKVKISVFGRKPWTIARSGKVF